MNARKSTLILALALLLAVPTGVRGQDGPAEPAPNSNAARALALVDEIAREVEEYRGLAFKEEFQRKVITSAELAVMAEKMMREELPPELLAGTTKLWGRLGFFPVKSDLIEQFSAFLEMGAAGLYDPKEKTLYLIGDFSPDAARPILFHELVHALDDQYFDLAAFQEKSMGNSDIASAWQSVVEGCAAHLQNVYTAKNPKYEQALMMEMMKSAMKQMQAMQKVPVIFTASQGIFPYGNAPAWLAAVTDGVPEAISKLYDNPPASTEQVLHPEKFGPDGDYPHRVALPDLAETLGADWAQVQEDTIGELHISLLLNEFMGGPIIGKLMRIMSGGGAQNLVFRGEVKTAAEGWDGDRTRAYEGPDGRIGIVWVSRWDTPEDAVQFANAYRRGERYKQATFGYDGMLVVDVDGSTVTIVEGFSEEATPAILESVNNGAEIVPSRRDKADVTAAIEAGTWPPKSETATTESGTDADGTEVGGTGTSEPGTATEGGGSGTSEE